MSSAAHRLRGRIGALTIGTIASLLVFAGLDAAAKLTGYRHGETFSRMIQNAQKLHPSVRVAVTGTLLYLIGHLELGWPL